MNTELETPLGPETLFTPEEAADMLRISVRTLEAHRAKGTAPRCIRIGPRKLAFRLTDLREFIASQPTA